MNDLTTNQVQKIVALNYEECKKQLIKELKKIKVPIILSDDDMREVKFQQVKLNHLVDDLKKKRISVIREVGGEFESQVTELEKLIVEKVKETKKALADYKPKKEAKVVTIKADVKEYTLTITTTDDELVNQINALCKNKFCSIKLNEKELK